MTSRKLAAAVAAGVLVAFGAGAAAAATLTTDTLYEQDSGLTVQGCAVRFDPVTLTPFFATNSAHRCPGFNSVRVNSYGDMVISTDDPGLIVSAIAVPDETLVQAGITAGVSRDPLTATVRFADRAGRISAKDKRLYVKNANVWLLFVGVRE